MSAIILIEEFDAFTIGKTIRVLRAGQSPRDGFFLHETIHKTLEIQLEKLQKLASALEPLPGERSKIRDAVIAYGDGFLDSIDDRNAYNFPSDSRSELLDLPISEDGIGIEKALAIIEKDVDHPGLNPASGGHLGYIPGGGIYYSALGDYLADISNRYAAIFYASPGGVRMENLLIKWVAGLLGFPETAAGNLTSGGSLANLIAICTARDAMGVTAEKITRSVIYLTPQAHHSVQKAIRIAGLGECVLRYIDTDERYRMNTARLRERIAEDRERGFNPFLIIASAGTTDTGAIDPLEEMAGIARSEGAWLHTDAAYGGFFMLTEEGKEKMKGIGLADSITIDPHKGLFVPYGLGIVVIRDREKLFQTHYYQANYMQDTLTATEELSPADLSPELTKHFRGMRLWLPLQLHGLKPFRACLEEKLLLAKYFYQKVKALGFECDLEPELSVVIYRYVPKNGDADEFNSSFVEAVKRDGRVFISSTVLNGKFTLRFACLSFRTHKKHVDILLEILENEIRAGRNQPE